MDNKSLVNELCGFVEDIYSEYGHEYIVTPRVAEILCEKCSFADDMELFYDSLKIDSSLRDLLVSKDIEMLVSDRQPNLSPVSDGVMSDVVRYFSDELSDSGYIPVKICRHSNHADDGYLYSVIAKNAISGMYSCWSSYNDSTHSMNYGHYNLDSEKEAFSIIRDNFYDITDDKDRFGPEKTLTNIPDTMLQSLQADQDSNIIPFRRRGR